MPVELTHPTAGAVVINAMPARPPWFEAWLQPSPMTAAGRTLGADPVRRTAATSLQWSNMASADAVALQNWHGAAVLDAVTLAGLGATRTVLLGQLACTEITPDRYRVTLEIEELL